MPHLSSIILYYESIIHHPLKTSNILRLRLYLPNDSHNASQRSRDPPEKLMSFIYAEQPISWVHLDCKRPRPFHRSLNEDSCKIPCPAAVPYSQFPLYRSEVLCIYLQLRSSPSHAAPPRRICEIALCLCARCSVYVMYFLRDFYARR